MTPELDTFFQAVTEQDLSCIQALLRSHPLLAQAAHPGNHLFSPGVTALMLAAEHGIPAIVHTLLPHSDANARCPSHAKKNALMHAAAHAVGESTFECVQILTPYTDFKRADLERRAPNALGWAVAGGSMECVQWLLPHSDPTWTQLNGGSAASMAAERGHLDMLELLLPVFLNSQSINKHDVDGPLAKVLLEAVGSLNLSTFFDVTRLLSLEHDPKWKPACTQAVGMLHEHLKAGMDASVVADAWAICDTLAPLSDRSVFMKLLRLAPAHAMPRSRAQLERETLAAALSESSTPLDPQRRKPPTRL